MFKAFAFSILVLSLGSCTQESGERAGGGKGFNRLSKAHQKAFTAWTNDVAKSCDASTVLASSPAPIETGIDLKALYKKIGQSSVIQDGEGSMAILGGHSTFSGYGETHYNQKVEVNGDVDEVDIRTERQGSMCDVYVFGEKVYSTKIASGLNVAGFHQPGKTMNPLPIRPDYIRTKSPSLAALRGHRIADAVWAKLLPTQEMYEFIGQELQLSDELVKTLFKKGTTADHAPLTIVLDGEEEYLFSEADDLLVAPKAMIASVLRPSESLKARAIIGNRLFYGITPAQSLEFTFTLNTLKEGDDLEIMIGDVDQGASALSYDRDRLKACLLDRITNLETQFAHERSLNSSKEAVATTCSVFTSDIDHELVQLDVGSLIYPELLRHATPSSAQYFDYRGWNHPFEKLARSIFEVGGISITEALDPEGKASVIHSVSSNFEETKEGLADYPTLARHLDSDFYEKAISWALYGERVSSYDLSDIFIALENSIDPFIESTRIVLFGLDTPRERDEAFRNAQNLDHQTKQAGRSALAAAQKINHTEWINQDFNRTLQKGLTANDFMVRADQFTSLYRALAPHKNLATRYEELSAIGQNLFDKGYSPTEIASVYQALSNVVTDFPEAAKDLIAQLKSNPERAQDDVDFALALDAQYKADFKLAMRLARAMDQERWADEKERTLFQARYPYALVRSWKQSLAAAQDLYSRDLKKIGGNPDNEWGFDRAFESLLEKSLEQGWSAADFSAFREIVSLGQKKSFCEDYKTLSKVSDCVGLRYLDKETGLLQDKYGSRYGKMAKIFGRYLKGPWGHDPGFFNQDLVSAFFSSTPIWSECSQPEVDRLLTRLDQRLESLRLESETFEAWEKEREIKDSFRSCTL